MNDTTHVTHESRWLARGATLAIAVFWSASGYASPTYPGLIKDDIKALTGLDMPCTPPCTLCHRDLQGGRGTVSQPFGLSMMANGLTYADPPSLASALAALRAKAIDSDGDGAVDVDELSQGNDPDVPGPGQLCLELPRYGCGAHVAPARPVDRLGPAAVVGFLAALSALRRRRRR